MNGNSGTTRLHEAADQVREDLSELGVEAGRVVRQQATGIKEGFEEKVRNNPLKALAIAAGIGAIIGYLLRRK